MRVFRLAAALPVGCLVSGGAGYGCGCAVPVYGGCGWLVGGLCVPLLVGRLVSGPAVVERVQCFLGCSGWPLGAHVLASRPGPITIGGGDA